MNVKHVSQPRVITPGILVLALLAAAVALVGLTGIDAPLLGNPTVAILALVALGMAICALGGIGRVAAVKQWKHPLSIVGYMLGGLILLITAAALLGIGLPLVRNDQQALAAIAVLMVVKMLISILHSALARP